MLIEIVKVLGPHSFNDQLSMANSYACAKAFLDG